MAKIKDFFSFTIGAIVGSAAIKSIGSLTLPKGVKNVSQAAIGIGVIGKAKNLLK